MPNEIWFFRVLWILILWIPLLVSAPSWAGIKSAESTPLVQAPGVSPEAFEAYARASGRQTYSESLDVISPAANESLSRLVERAQEAWVDSSLTVAQSLFEQVADLALENDWREPEREAIQYSMLRLAQLSSSSADQDRWIEKAISFDWEHRPDPSLFPPPLLQRVRAIQEKMLKNAKPVRLDKLFPDYRWVRINGRRFNATDRKSVPVPIGRFRISAYSDSMPAINEKMETEQLLSFIAKLKSLVSGTCSSPEGGDAALGRFTAFDAVFEEQCLRRRNVGGWIRKGESSSASVPSQGLPMNWPTLPDESSSRPSLSRRSWIWVGVSVLVVGAAYHVYQQQREHDPQAQSPTSTQVQPVHRQGY